MARHPGVKPRSYARAGARAALSGAVVVAALRAFAAGGEGRLVMTLRAEPKTFNPLVAADGPSRDVIHPLMASLVQIDRESQLTRPALAEICTPSADGRSYTLRLRRGLRFSDGHPFGARDVAFSFQVALDPAVESAQGTLLRAGGPPSLVVIDEHTVRLDLAAPHGAGERLFDGVPMLPRHVLEPAYRAGRLREAWSLSARPEEVVGLGPFRLRSYDPGRQVVLERNPHYWRRDEAGRPLPRLQELVFVPVGNEEAQVLRFRAGESHLLSRLSADNFDALSSAPNGSRRYLRDLGPSLEYSAIVFNKNEPGPAAGPQLEQRQAWFKDVRFRRAVSLAIDRDAIVRLVYRGRATPLSASVTPGNRRFWTEARRARPRSAREALALLAEAGFVRGGAGQPLRDPAGRRVSFTLLTSAGNTQRERTSALVQEDLREVGMDVQVVPVEFRALTDRLLRGRDYDAALVSLGGGDADPNSEMPKWTLGGSMRLWRLDSKAPPPSWEAELDALMRSQHAQPDLGGRRRAYERVQDLLAEHLPFVFLVSPHALAAWDARLKGVRPAVLEPQLHWNVDEVHFAR